VGYLLTRGDRGRRKRELFHVTAIASASFATLSAPTPEVGIMRNLKSNCLLGRLGNNRHLRMVLVKPNE